MEKKAAVVPREALPHITERAKAAKPGLQVANLPGAAEPREAREVVGGTTKRPNQVRTRRGEARAELPAAVKASLAAQAEQAASAVTASRELRALAAMESALSLTPCGPGQAA